MIEFSPLAARVHALIAQWRRRADAIIEDVNNGQAPTYEADRAKGWTECAFELEAELVPPTGEKANSSDGITPAQP